MNKQSSSIHSKPLGNADKARQVVQEQQSTFELHGQEYALFMKEMIKIQDNQINPKDRPKEYSSNAQNSAVPAATLSNRNTSGQQDRFQRDNKQNFERIPTKSQYKKNKNYASQNYDSPSKQQEENTSQKYMKFGQNESSNKQSGQYNKQQYQKPNPKQDNQSSNQKQFKFKFDDKVSNNQTTSQPVNPVNFNVDPIWKKPQQNEQKQTDNQLVKQNIIIPNIPPENDDEDEDDLDGLDFINRNKFGNESAPIHSNLPLQQKQNQKQNNLQTKMDEEDDDDEDDDRDIINIVQQIKKETTVQTTPNYGLGHAKDQSQNGMKDKWNADLQAKPPTSKVFKNW